MTTDLTSGDGNGISDVTSLIAADSANSDSDVSGTQGGTHGATQGGPKKEEVIQIIVTEATTTDNGTDSDGSEDTTVPRRFNDVIENSQEDESEVVEEKVVREVVSSEKVFKSTVHTSTKTTSSHTTKILSSPKKVSFTHCMPVHRQPVISIIWSLFPKVLSSLDLNYIVPFWLRLN